MPPMRRRALFSNGERQQPLSVGRGTRARVGAPRAAAARPAQSPPRLSWTNRATTLDGSSCPPGSALDRSRCSRQGRNEESTAANGVPRRLPRQRVQRPARPCWHPLWGHGAASAKGGPAGLAGLQGHR
eukprot:5611256-Alexandrium_andersonii.AAC.2